MTLRLRLVLSYSLMVVATICVVLILGFLVVRGQLLAGTDFLLEAEFKEIEPKLQKVKPPKPDLVSTALLEHVTIDASIYFFQVRDEYGDILFRSPNLGDKVLPDLSGGEPGSQSYPLNGSLLRVGEYRTGPFKVAIASRLDYLSELNRRLTQDFAIAIPAVLLLSALMGWWLGEMFLRPIRSIEQTARRISISNLRERIPAGRGRDEIARLSILLNQMFDRLEKSFERMKQFTADLSHELRTPLSIVTLHTEKLMKRPGIDLESRAELEDVLVETKRLNQIIDQILVLAKAEAQALPLVIARHSTPEFIADFAEDAAALAESAGKKFLLRKNEPLSAEFDQSWIRQVLFNLLSNSIQFSAHGSTIELESSVDGSNWCVVMTDRGQGIPPEQREAVFERFKQLAQTSDPSQGTGLGLAVCKSIVELHGGEIRLEGAPEQPGLQVRIKLPLGGE